MTTETDLNMLVETWRNKLSALEFGQLDTRQGKEREALGSRLATLKDLPAILQKMRSLNFQFKPGETERILTTYNELLQAIGKAS
jgi:hypothetical protein